MLEFKTTSSKCTELNILRPNFYVFVPSVPAIFPMDIWPFPFPLKSCIKLFTQWIDEILKSRNPTWIYSSSFRVYTVYTLHALKHLRKYGMLTFIR